MYFYVFSPHIRNKVKEKNVKTWHNGIMIEGVFNNVRTDLSLYLLVGKKNSQTTDDQKTKEREGKWNHIGPYESKEDGEARPHLEYSNNCHEATRSHNEKDPLLLLNSPFNYKRPKMNKTKDNDYNIIFL